MFDTKDPNMLDSFLDGESYRQAGILYFEKGFIRETLDDYDAEFYSAFMIHIPRPIEVSEQESIPTLTVKFASHTDLGIPSSYQRKDHKRIFINMGWTKGNFEHIIPSGLYMSQETNSRS